MLYILIKKNTNNRYIEIISKRKNYRIVLSFKKDAFSPMNMTSNQKIDLVRYINWDVELETNKRYYLFDISKEKVILTKKSDNVFNIQINVENPDMIYSSFGEKATFNKLLINTDFSFSYEEQQH